MIYFEFDTIRFENTETFKRKLAEVLNDEAKNDMYADDNCFDEWLVDVEIALRSYEDYIVVPAMYSRDGKDHRVYFTGYIRLINQWGYEVATWDGVWNDDFYRTDLNGVDEVRASVDFDEA